MSDGEKTDAQKAWDRLAESIPPRTAAEVGTKCASMLCHTTRGITYDKPLCYGCWTAFDAYEIDECPQCHWFVDEAELLDFEDGCACLECAKGQAVPPYAHAAIGRQIRYLYILKLNGGQYYVGQTKELGLRLQEHRDGLTRSTKGKNPQLVYFEERRGDKDVLDEAEERLTMLNKRNPRAIRRIVAKWQSLIRLVHVET